MKRRGVFLVLIMILIFNVGRTQNAEELTPKKKDIDNSMEGWAGLYTKYRIGKKLYYYGEYHYRRRNNLKDMAQVYLRFGVTYLLSKKLELTGGIVTPFYWAPDQQADNIDKVVPQYRMWEQMLFVQSFSRAKIYHQIRTEQRWKRDYEKDSPFELSWRFRYKLSMYAPLNHSKLINKTLFLSAYEEIFIQAGRKIVYNHLEDNRIFIGLGYIFNENIQLQAGYMLTYRHDGSPYDYVFRHIPRISFYHGLDFYSRRKAKQEVQMNRILRDEF